MELSYTRDYKGDTYGSCESVIACIASLRFSCLCAGVDCTCRCTVPDHSSVSGGFAARSSDRCTGSLVHAQIKKGEKAIKIGATAPFFLYL